MVGSREPRGRAEAAGGGGGGGPPRGGGPGRGRRRPASRWHGAGRRAALRAALEVGGVAAEGGEQVVAGTAARPRRRTGARDRPTVRGGSAVPRTGSLDQPAMGPVRTWCGWRDAPREAGGRRPADGPPWLGPPRGAPRGGSPGGR